MANLVDLQAQWTKLYSETLPALARARDPAQPNWPVTLDHHFARIILDNTVGDGKVRWEMRIQKPAVRNMSEEQLKQAIDLGEKIKDGSIDIVALDMQSLETQGRGQIKYEGSSLSQSAMKTLPESGREHKRTIEDDDGEQKIGSQIAVPPQSKKHQTTLPFKSSQLSSRAAPKQVEDIKDRDLTPLLHMIAFNPLLTPYRKRLYSTLCSVPPGKYTTYAALAEFLHSSPRAVGNGMRHNPFAPHVPCHRVLAADGSIGGFGGHWGKAGVNAGKKYELLRSEGVRFDVRGKVIGEPFRKLEDLTVYNGE